MCFQTYWQYVSRKNSINENLKSKFRISVVEHRKMLTHHFENDIIAILERLETPQQYDRHQIHLMKKFTFQKGPLSFYRGRKSRLSLKPGSSRPKNYPVPFESVWDGVKIPPKIYKCTINNDVIKARSSCNHKCGPKCNRYCKSDEFINSICSLDGSGELFGITYSPLEIILIWRYRTKA